MKLQVFVLTVKVAMSLIAKPVPTTLLLVLISMIVNLVSFLILYLKMTVNSYLQSVQWPITMTTLLFLVLIVMT